MLSIVVVEVVAMCCVEVEAGVEVEVGVEAVLEVSWWVNFVVMLRWRAVCCRGGSRCYYSCQTGAALDLDMCKVQDMINVQVRWLWFTCVVRLVLCIGVVVLVVTSG